VIGRLYIIQPFESKKYYLWILLTHVKGTISFDDLKSVNKHLYENFKKVCVYLGLLQNDVEWNAYLHEISKLQIGQ